MINSEVQLAALESSMVALRRMQRRRGLGRHADRRGLRRGRYGELPDSVLELVDLVDEEAAAGRSITITAAGELLGVDQPRASRLVAAALDAGLLRRVADQDDGRRSLLRLTSAGRRLLNTVHDFRRRTIDEATAEWSERDRRALARLLPRFVDDFAAVVTGTGDGRS